MAVCGRSKPEVRNSSYASIVSRLHPLKRVANESTSSAQIWTARLFQSLIRASSNV